MIDKIPTPKAVFCPKCGEAMKLEKISDPQTQTEIIQKGFAVGARGMCECGVTAVLAIKKMPANPTFTLMFNIYKLEVG